MEILSFWGKGGVGKSTLSAASAVYLAEKGYKVQLVSTDYTPSLGFLLGMEGEEGEAMGGRLKVVQLSEERIIMLWKERFGEEVYRVASSIFPVGREVIDYVAGAPGIVEEFALYVVYEAWRRGGYDVLVWDTMAAGGGLRMLRLEKEFYEHLGEAAKMYLKVKGTIERIRRGEKSPLELIEEWRSLASEILDMVRSASHHGVLVARAYPLDVDVAWRIWRQLGELGVRVEAVIANMAEERACSELPGPCCAIPPWRVPPRGVEKLYRLASETCLGETVEKLLASS